jgi:hypothetical protein
MRAEAKLLWIAICLCAAAARAEDGISRERFEALERQNAALLQSNDDLAERLSELEKRDQERVRGEEVRDLGSPLAEWTRRIRLSGSANTGYYYGSDESPFQDVGFQVWDARLFLDADLGRDVRVGEAQVARNMGFSFEWNAVRLGEVQGTDDPTLIGETYVEFQGIAGSSWANAQVGRFQIPVGENYLRFSKGYRNNPFISNTVGGPWWWDEGVRIYGSSDDSRFGYVASISDGDTPFADDTSRELQFTGKVWTQPWPWLRASASVLRSGQSGNDNEPGSGALWLGETWATPVGSLSWNVPTWQDGAIVPAAPNGIDSTTLFAGDLILTSERFGRLWLAFGHYGIEAEGGGDYDRDLLYWIAEWVLDGDAIAPELAPFYLALRANGLGTYDADEGYLLDVRTLGNLGYNAQSLEEYNLALGWHLTRWATLRLEYTRREIELVDGASRALGNDAGGEDEFAIELGAAF